MTDTLNYNNSGAPEESFHPEEDMGVNLREIFFIVHRRKEIIFGVAAFVIALMAIFLLLQTPLYTAYSVIRINVQADRVVDLESVVSGISSDESSIRSEIDVLRSRSLASRVIDKLHLIDDKEFNPRAGKGTFSWMVELISFDDKTKDELKKEAQIIKTLTINKFIKRASILRSPRSYTVNVKFTSTSADKSRDIANTIVEEYLLGQLSDKFDATKRANEWLNKKIMELQKKLRQSEMAVQMFREQNGLIETAGMTVSDQQLSQLNTQLILARTERSQAEARLGSSKASINSSMEVLGSRLIQSLREQEIEVLRKKSDLQNRYGARHPKMINVQAEMRELRSNIKNEIEKIRVGLQKEVEIAKAREDSLEKSLNQLQVTVGSSTKARVQLAELLRDRNTNSSLYENFLARSKETSSNKGLDQADARIISIAESPLRPSYPRKLLLILVSIILGSGLGFVTALLIEYLDNAFKNSHQLEKLTGIASIGIVPELDKRTNFSSYVSTKMSSVFVESLRSIMTAIHFSNPDKMPKSILITSSVPEEGKTTFSVSMASMLAKSGRKVLLVDCDLKKPSVAKKFGVTKTKYGLGDYLTGEATEKQVINIDKRTGLHFISAHADTANSQDLLGSNKMKEFVEEMSAKYDLVLLDSPPVMAVSDAIIAAKIVDTVVFIVRWSKTPRQIVKTALNKLKYSNAKLAGTILTHVNLNKLSKYGDGDQGYYYKKYGEYYNS